MDFENFFGKESHDPEQFGAHSKSNLRPRTAPRFPRQSSMKFIYPKSTFHERERSGRNNNICYREYETVTTLENVEQERSSSPHHFDEFLGHVKLLSAEIHSFRLQFEAIKPQKSAAIVRRLIDGDEEKMIQQSSRVLSHPKTTEKHIEHRRIVFDSLIRIRLIYHSDNHRLVRHRRLRKRHIQIVS